MKKEDIEFVLLMLSTPPFAMAIGAFSGFICFLIKEWKENNVKFSKN